MHAISRLACAAALAAGCGGDEPPADTTGGTAIGSTIGSTQAHDDSSGEGHSSGPSLESSSGTSGGTSGDPAYPRPEPVDQAGTCPPGTFGPITYDGDGWLCLPPCVGDPPSCPDPMTGDAEALCATNPMSSAAPCGDSNDCEVEGEMCGNIGGGNKGCLLPPSHCILRCDEGQTCPDGLTCAEGPGICEYEA